MKIKYYTCECGEEIYEDDTRCCNCGSPADSSKFITEDVPEIRQEGRCFEEEQDFLTGAISVICVCGEKMKKGGGKFVCTNCGAEYRSTENLLKGDKKKKFRKNPR